MKSAQVLIVLALLSGCQTGAEYDAQIQAALDSRLSAYQGATMAEFTARTGLLPSNMYPVEGGRVFVIVGPPVFLTTPATQWTPAITQSSACQLLVRTVPIGQEPTADNWKIIGTQRSGPCNNLPV